MEKIKKIDSRISGKVWPPNSSDEIDLYADIDQQPMAILAYERSFNDYCVNCKSQPCKCHLMPTI